MEEAVFDPSLKKKKKKKKTPFDLDAAMEGGAAGADEDQPEVQEAADGAEDEDPDLASFGGKKKKNKKKANFDEETEAAEEVPDLGVDDIDLESLGKKKKKKAVILNLDVQDNESDEDKEDMDLESFGKKKKKKKRAGLDLADEEADKDAVEANPWMTDDRDYTYDELLQRVFAIMRDKNPEMVAGEKKKFVMRPPQVVRVGTKKTAFVNFTEIAKMLHRQPKHLLAFLFAELGTVGSIDGNSQLVMKGRFQQKHIENVLRRYIKEYVTCHTCRSPDTILNKETRLFFLQCMTCHSRCSVQTIKTGFQAVTGKRAAIRAKQ